MKLYQKNQLFVAVGIANLMLHTHDNTDGNKLIIFSGIALYYSDNYILYLHESQNRVERLCKNITAALPQFYQQGYVALHFANTPLEYSKLLVLAHFQPSM